jgi:Ca-activated chloride channel family protein
MIFYGQEAPPQAIEGLNDIVVPESIALVPQTVGWVILLAVAIGAVVAAGIALRRRYLRNAYRREALALVPSTPLPELPALVKRVALAAAPRTEVAAPTGDAWLAFLDRTYGGTSFSQGPGRMLATLSFAPLPDDRSGSADELRALVSLWVRKHRV